MNSMELNSSASDEHQHSNLAGCWIVNINDILIVAAVKMAWTSQ